MFGRHLFISENTQNSLYKWNIGERTFSLKHTSPIVTVPITSNLSSFLTRLSKSFASRTCCNNNNNNKNSEDVDVWLWWCRFLSWQMADLLCHFIRGSCVNIYQTSKYLGHHLLLILKQRRWVPRWKITQKTACMLGLETMCVSSTEQTHLCG